MRSIFRTCINKMLCFIQKWFIISFKDRVCFIILIYTGTVYSINLPLNNQASPLHYPPEIDFWQRQLTHYRTSEGYLYHSGMKNNFLPQKKNIEFGYTYTTTGSRHTLQRIGGIKLATVWIYLTVLKALSWVKHNHHYTAHNV